MEMDEKLLSVMVDMYLKCGYIIYVERVFVGVTN